jgi:polyisoprenoid-binding protein YceI
MSMHLKFWWRSASVAILAALLNFSQTALAAGAQAPEQKDIPSQPSASAVAGHYHVDEQASQLRFCVRRIPATKVEGEFGNFRGDFDIPVQSLEATVLNVEINTGSVDTGNRLINSVVTSKEFFSAKEHPEISFHSSSIRLTGEHTAQLSGLLTIRGVTRPVSFEVNYTFDPVKPNEKGRTVSFNGELVISRSEFGMKALSGIVSDKVRIMLSARAHSDQTSPPKPAEIAADAS